MAAFSFFHQRLPSESPKWSKAQLLAKSFVKNVTHLLETLDNHVMLEFVLQNLSKQHGLVYVACFSKAKLGRTFLAVSFGFWLHYSRLSNLHIIFC
jgi:hypothetical protein